MRRAHLRIARPTNNLARLTKMYSEGLGLAIAGSFEDHEGFDGAMLGHPDQEWHLEFTHQRGVTVTGSPDKEHLLVFYVPDEVDWNGACARMTTAGFREVQAHNPYWDVNGRTFEDPEGYRIVMQRSSWR
ncbi:MAG: VOC family protein [Myxococcota bacterium]